MVETQHKSNVSEWLDLALFRLARHVMVRPLEKRFALGLLDKAPSLKKWVKARVVGNNATPEDPPDVPCGRNLFVDASRLAGEDGNTGIPRVTRSVLFSLMEDPPEGLNVVPVFATKRQPGYFELKGHGLPFEQRNASSPGAGKDPSPISFGSGDIFLCLDYNPLLMNIQRYYLSAIQKEGVKIFTIVHDLIPIRMPEKCPPGQREMHEDWLRTILRFNGAICVSRTVAEDLRQWVLEEAPEKKAPFHIAWFHLGADFERFPPLKGSVSKELSCKKELSVRPFILMVGTVEGRKGYSQALEAFEVLWGRGEDVSLVIVGKEGWLVQDLVKRIRSHPELGKRLLWFEDLGDERLSELYCSCRALLMASESEGFGLPLVEAARAKAPLIARDLPIMREVTGGRAFFFKGETAVELADSIEEWFDLFNKGVHPKPDGVPWRTWAQSSKQLSEAILAMERQGCKDPVSGLEEPL